MDSAVGRLLLRLTGAGLLAVSVVALVAPRPVITPLRWPVVLLGVAVLAVIALLVRVPRVLLRGWVPGFVAFAGGIFATLIGLAGRYDYGWDARVVMDLARTLDAGRPLPAWGIDYLSLYPNNLTLLAVDEFGHLAARQTGLLPDEVLIALGGLCVGVTLYAVHDLVVRVAGRGSALAAQAVTLVLVATSPWVAVPYTDLLAMPFVTGGAALAARALASGPRRARVVLWGLSILAMTVAYALKTTPVVIVIAVAVTVIIAVFDGHQHLGRRAAGLAACAGGLVVFSALAVAVPSLAQQASGADTSALHTEKAPTPLWWVALGSAEVTSDTGVTSYGSYSRELVEAIDGMSPSQMDDYSVTFLAARWDERGLTGTGAFYGSKLAWNWGDGMFGAWGEGGDSLPGVLAPATGGVGLVHELNGYHGTWYPLRSELVHSLWIALLLLAGIGLLRAPYRREVVLLAVTVLGIATFTLIFQGRARYLLTFVPIVVALAGTVHPFVPRLRSVRGRAPSRGRMMPVDERRQAGGGHGGGRGGGRGGEGRRDGDGGRRGGPLTAWLDVSAGVAGDMVLGALVDAGASLEVSQAAIDAVIPGTVRLVARQTSRSGLRALKIDVELLARDSHHRPWAEIRGRLATAPLDETVRTRALAVFERLASAEARVHGIPVDDVHFHEVGAWDSIADVVGCCAALTDLGVVAVTAGRISLGSGTVRAGHGRLPVPVPAVLELCRGWDVISGGDGELATPTGVALVTALATEQAGLPELTVSAVGVGAGTREQR